MQAYVLLLRGVNVGGKNKVPMADLREGLTGLGYHDVRTYIASGNAIISSADTPVVIKGQVEQMLVKKFQLDNELIKVLVLTRGQLNSVIKRKPKGFGDQPNTYHSDAIFLIGIDAAEAMRVFDPRDGVDAVWSGDGVIYSQRVSAERTKSRLNKIVGTPAYKSMTIRSWNTVMKLMALLDETKAV